MIDNLPLPANVKIVTQEQAVNYVKQLVTEMLVSRAKCDQPDPYTVKQQKRNLWTFLNKQGQVLGALNALLYTGNLSEKVYKEMHQTAINSLIPTNIKRT